MSVLIIMLLVLCWSILLNSVIGQQILTPDDMRIVRDNDKFLYKYLPQVVTKKFEYDSRLKADLIEIVNLSLNKLIQAESS